MRKLHHGGEGNILTAKFYNSTHYSDILEPKKREPEKKAVVQPEGVMVDNKEQTITKQ